MREIGYDNDFTPEYDTLDMALRNDVLVTRNEPVHAGDRESLWELISAYREAFSAVYGDSAEAAAFKSEFEQKADERAQEQTDANAAVPEVPDADQNSAYEEARAELKRLQQQERALQATANAAEERKVNRRLKEFDTQAEVDQDEQMAFMVEEIREFLRNGKAADSTEVQDALKALEEYAEDK